jgi:DNA-binding transcriptional regulator YiaG
LDAKADELPAPRQLGEAEFDSPGAVDWVGPSDVVTLKWSHEIERYINGKALSTQRPFEYATLPLIAPVVWIGSSPTNALPSSLMNTNDLVELARVRSMSKAGTARTIRLGAGLSLGEVAKAVGVSEVAIYRWEQGQRSPRGVPALKYAQVLAALLGKTGNPRGTKAGVA